MDFEAIWQTHKPFILKVLGGALVFLILAGVRNSLAESATAQAKKNRSNRAAIEDKVAQVVGREGLEKGRADALAETLEPALAKALFWTPAEGYILPSGEKSAALFYDNARHASLGKVKRHAARWNAKVPSGASGFGLREEISAPEVPEALAWADLVERVTTGLLDAGVRRIDTVEPRTARYTKREGDGKFVRELPLGVTFEATTELASKALEAFQAPGNFLELRECRLSRKGDDPKAPLEVNVEFVALFIVATPPKNAEAVSAGGSSGSRRPTRGPRRVRRWGRER
tara:strand:- start:1727 stop:2587 length:861 start_codon:yes stop_codon:yes gene_type:complete